MTEFTVNPHRFDPYKNFKYRVYRCWERDTSVAEPSELSSTHG
jgi:hypothetical protein